MVDILSKPNFEARNIQGDHGESYTVEELENNIVAQIKYRKEAAGKEEEHQNGINLNYYLKILKKILNK